MFTVLCLSTMKLDYKKKKKNPECNGAGRAVGKQSGFTCLLNRAECYQSNIDFLLSFAWWFKDMD